MIDHKLPETDTSVKNQSQASKKGILVSKLINPFPKSDTGFQNWILLIRIKIMHKNTSKQCQKQEKAGSLQN